MLALVSISLMSFSEIKKQNAIKNEFNTIEIEIIEETSDPEIVNCKWRTCVIFSDGSKMCGVWIYGQCNKDDDGKLTKIQ